MAMMHLDEEDLAVLGEAEDIICEGKWPFTKLHLCYAREGI